VVALLEATVAEHGEEDVASVSGEDDEGLVVAFALSYFAVMVGTQASDPMASSWGPPASTAIRIAMMTAAAIPTSVSDLGMEGTPE
jgi:hypothetical protein